MANDMKAVRYHPRNGEIDSFRTQGQLIMTRGKDVEIVFLFEMTKVNDNRPGSIV